MRNKAQSSLEIIILFSLAAVVFLAIFISSNVSISSFKSSTEERLARTTLEQIAQAGQRVYAQGEGAVEQLYVRFPDATNSTFINGTVIEIRLEIENERIQKVQRIVPYDTQGTLPNSSGVHSVVIMSNGSFVYIR